MTERAPSVTELVRRLFWRDKRARAEHETKTAAVDSATADSVLPPQLSPGPIVASRLQLIGLERVRTLLGDRWSKLAERVRGIAQTIIEKHLLPGDVYETHGDDGFLVLFPKLSLEDARFKSAAICRQIEERLIGSMLTDVSACSFEVFTIDPDHLSNLEHESPISIGAQDTILTRERLRHDTVSPSRPRDVDAHRGTPPTTLVPDASVGGTPKSSPGLAQSSAGDDKAKTASATARVVPLTEPALSQWVYRPVWDFQLSALLTFALIPFRLNTTGVTRDAVPPGSVDEEFLAKLDNAALSKGVSDLEILAASGRRLPILVQIHYTTVVNARRRALFLGKVKTITPERRKLISFEVVECPQDGLTLGFTEFMTAMRAFGLRMAMSVPTDWRDFRGIERCGFKIATMDASNLSLSEKTKMSEFEKFSDRTANAKLESAIWGLATRSLVIAATSAGVRHLAGRAITEDAPNLSHALRFSLADIYLHLQ